MIDRTIRSAFEARAAKPVSPAMVAAETAMAKERDLSAVQSLAAAFVHTAFLAPETAATIYEAFSKSWLDGTLNASQDIVRTSEALSPEFWNAFWALLDDTSSGTMNATTFTERVAGLGKFLPPSLRERSEKAARVALALARRRSCVRREPVP